MSSFTTINSSPMGLFYQGSLQGLMHSWKLKETQILWTEQNGFSPPLPHGVHCFNFFADIQVLQKRLSSMDNRLSTTPAATVKCQKQQLHASRRDGSGREARVEQLWQEFFSDPSQWWDKRLSKKTAKQPDFIHKTTLEGLWANSRWNPSWVNIKIAALDSEHMRSSAASTSGGTDVNADVVIKLCQEGLLQKALLRVNIMVEKTAEAPLDAFVCLLKECAKRRALTVGKQVHALILKSRCESNILLANNLINMYSKCGSVLEAQKVFAAMRLLNVISWNSMIAVYTHNGLGKDALALYNKMKQEGMRPTTVTLVLVLKACAGTADLEQGKQIHSIILKRRLKSNVIVQTALVDMYAKCGCLQAARELFDNMSERNLVSWNAMIAGYAHNGLNKEALYLYEQMVHERMQPDMFTVSLLLKACASLSALEQGRQLHSLIRRRGLESDVVLQTSLIDMYAKCGCLADAHELFNNMSERNAVSWNVMIAGYAQHGLGKEALALYEQMIHECMQPDSATFVPVLKACASISALEQGKEVHSAIRKKYKETDVVLQNSLIEMYAKCGCLVDARELFNNMTQRNAVSWNTMMGGYIEYGLEKEALALYDQMKQEGTQASNVTFVLLLKACGSISALEEGKQIHSLIIEEGVELDVILQNALVDMYARCGCLEDARQLFDNMINRDVISWNVMITAYIQNGLGKEAIDLYEQMKIEGVLPDSTTFILMLKACASSSALDQGKQLHALIVQRGLDLDATVQNTLVDMYAKCGCLEYARELFNNMTKQDVVSWNVMIAGYVLNGLGQEALGLYNEMKDKGVQPDSITHVLVLKACGSILSMEQGKELRALTLRKVLESDVIVQDSFSDMYKEGGCPADACGHVNNIIGPDVVLWNKMITDCGQNRLGNEALAPYKLLKHRRIMRPNIPGSVPMLGASASISGQEHTKHSQTLRGGFDSEVMIQNTLIDMYARCGCLDDARALFDNMTGRDVVSWNVMIAGYGRSGLGKEALALYMQMKHEGLQADKITYVCVLSACSHAGLVDEGRHVFETLSRDHTVPTTLEHYVCIVDLLGRSGFLADAEDIVLKMPFQPPKKIWMSLLGAARKHGNLEVGRRAFDRLVKQESEDAAPYLLLIDIYSEAGRTDEAARLREEWVV